MFKKIDLLSIKFLNLKEIRKNKNFKYYFLNMIFILYYLNIQIKIFIIIKYFKFF